MQKVQNAAVRFIFGVYGKQKRTSAMPLLQKAHFLPIRSRVKYKLCTMVFKCLNGMAPQYLSDLLHLRQPNSHQLRLDDDFFLLDTPANPKLSRTEGAFSYSAPNAWNILRASSEYLTFKSILKTHLFELAYKN